MTSTATVLYVMISRETKPSFAFMAGSRAIGPRVGIVRAFEHWIEVCGIGEGLKTGEARGDN